MNGLRAAIAFLTRIPVTTPHVTMGRAAPWFPVVGLGIGCLQGAVLVTARTVLPPGPAAVLAVAAAALLTGAFHHDGLADMADAFGGGWTVDRRLEIMKDSRLGTYGTTALVLALAAEISVLTVLDPAAGFRALVAAHCLSRAVAVVTMALAPQAGDGLGAAYSAELSVTGAAVAGLFAVVVTAVALAGTWLAVPAVAAAIVAAVAVVALAKRKIGGITGDVLGAIQQMSSLAVLFVATAGL